MNPIVRRSLVLPVIFGLLGLVIIACQGVPPPSTRPTVIISSPPSGSLYSLGEKVVVQSTATDPLGVVKVSLLVDNVIVREDPSPVSQGQAQYSLIQTWVADKVGDHTLTVRATNSQGVTADGGIIITVQNQGGIGPTAIIAIATAVPLVTSAPTLAPLATLAPTGNPANPSTAVPPTEVPPPTSPPPCTYTSKFLADLTIPDGTIFTPNAVFTKSWRVQNTGTCPWNSASLVFVSGAQLAASGIFPVPETPAGATADLTIPMSAPSNYGVYAGTWRIRNSSGQLLGTPLTVVINVPSPATAVPPTHTPVPTSPSGCSGQPNDFTFSSSTTTITVGQSLTLSWTAVTNASEVRINGGEFSNEGVETPGNRTVSPNSNTSYTLTAKCNNGGQTRKKTVDITVNAAVGNFSGHWDHNFGWMDLTQSGAQVTGTYHNSLDGGNGTVAGLVTGNTLNGTYQKTGTGTIQFVLGGGGNTFNGNWNGTNQWCGARTGVSFPSNCAFDGTWNTRYDPAPGTACSMNLSQTGTQVQGTYCNGTLSGTVSFVGGEMILNGTWNFPTAPSSGSLAFYLPAYTFKQFKGNYNTNLDWCGWRNGSSAPSPCLK